MPALPPAIVNQHPSDALPYKEAMIPLASASVGSWQFSINRRPLARPELKKTYDLQAATWTKKLKRLRIQSSYEGALRHVLSDTAVRDGSPLRVLDGGIGAGDLSIALAKTTGTDLSLDAFDISPRMLDESARRLSALGIHAQHHLADAARLPFDDNQFNIVMTAHMLEHLSDPAVALAELVRVLKPGGRIITFITRRSLLGFALQLKWRIHAVTPSIAEQWLTAQGLENVHSVKRRHQTLLDHLSVVCVGQKPTPSR